MRSLSSVVVACWVVAGCNGDTAPPGQGADAGGSIPALQAAFCKAARDCCTAAGFPAEPLADCESEFVRQSDYVAFVAKGTVTFDEAKLADCVAVIEEQSRTCLQTPTWCPDVFSGTIGDGGACTKAEECKKGNGTPVVCLKTGVTPDAGGKAGVCLPLVFGKDGEACAASCEKGRDCSFTSSTFETNVTMAICREVDDLYCDETSHCARLIADGAPCSFLGCSGTSYCDGVCKARRAEGEACADSDACGPEFRCTNGICSRAPLTTAKLCRGDFD